MAQIEIILSPERYFFHRITREVTHVGSGGWTRGIHATVPHPSVDERHATIEAIEGGYKLVDRSKGRTLARGAPIDEITLVHQMPLQFGEVRAIFHERGGPSGAPETLGLGLHLDDLPRRLWVVARDLSGRRKPQRVPLGAELEIGSAEGCGLRVEDNRVSKRHARIVRERTRLRLLDLGSTNGTIVGGLEVEACTLPLDATAQLGPVEVWVEAEADAVPALESFEGILTSHPSVLMLFPRIAGLAASRVPVVIQGETGTGKEGVARAIHARSPRSERPFVVLNVAAIPRHLFESELFGHIKGAFTGATSDQIGHFARADGGTLFLDEIGELPIELQAKLLRALQEGEYQPLGSGKTRRADVRVVAATNRDLLQEVRAGRFRADLYYRLAVGSVVLPPLRERGEDAVLLFGHFLAAARPDERPIPVSEAARARLRAHRWPGNVRELCNVAERAAIAAVGAGALGPEHLAFDGDAPDPSAPIALADLGNRTLEEYIAEREKEILAAALQACDGHRRRTAARVGLSHVTLLRKLRRYGLDR